MVERDIMVKNGLGWSLVIAFLLIEAVSILGIWAMSLAGGAFAGGVLTYQEGNYPILHLIAEGLMAALSLAGAVGLWRQARWGRDVALVACGALAYSATNSMGWTLHNNPPLAAPMVFTLIGVALAGPYLLRP